MTTSPATNPSNVHLPDPKLTKPWIRELDWITLWRMPSTLQNSVQVRSNMDAYTDMEIHLDFRAYKRGGRFSKLQFRYKKMSGKKQHFRYFLDIHISGHFNNICSKIGHFNPTYTDLILKIPDIWASTYI